MTHQQELDLMYRHMEKPGVWKSTAAPPAWRLPWHFGAEVPPPLPVARRHDLPSRRRL